MKKIKPPLAAKLLFWALERCEEGYLEVTTPDDQHFTFGNATSIPRADIQIRDWSILQRIMRRGDIALGETYSEGLWESTDLALLIKFGLKNEDAFTRYFHGTRFQRFWFYLFNNIKKRNSIRGSANNIRSHYDVGNSFYELWLDESMTYSSALRLQGDESLQQAQQQKYGRLLQKISKPGAAILEIGCGWGGFAEQAAAQQHQLTGLTISPSQYHFAKNRLGNKAQICLQDYRLTQGIYDAIISIEMFEAVGEKYWPAFFSTVKKSLAKSGLAIIQTITIADDLFQQYRIRSDYIRHHVFPGGMLPSQSRFTEEANRAGLAVKDTFTFGQDYAWTLREWRSRFLNKLNEINQMGYSDAFTRSWLFYLGLCIASFEVERTNVMQVELVHA